MDSNCNRRLVIAPFERTSDEYTLTILNFNWREVKTKCFVATWADDTEEALKNGVTKSLCQPSATDAIEMGDRAVVNCDGIHYLAETGLTKHSAFVDSKFILCFIKDSYHFVGFSKASRRAYYLV